MKRLNPLWLAWMNSSMLLFAGCRQKRKKIWPNFNSDFPLAFKNIFWMLQTRALYLFWFLNGGIPRIFFLFFQKCIIASFGEIIRTWSGNPMGSRITYLSHIWIHNVPVKFDVSTKNIINVMTILLHGRICPC